MHDKDKKHHGHGHEREAEPAEAVADEDQDEVVGEAADEVAGDREESPYEPAGSQLAPAWATLKSVFRKWQQHWKLLTGISVVGAVAVTLVALLGGIGVVGAVMSVTGSAVFTNATTGADILSVLLERPFVLTSIVSVGAALAAAILIIYTWMGLSTVAAWRFVMGEEHHEMSIRNAYRSTWPLVPGYIWIAILSMVFVMLGILGFVIPGFILGICFTMLPMVALVEERRGMSAIRRATALVRPKFLQVLWRFIVAGLVVYVPASIIFRILGAIFGRDVGDFVEQLYGILAGPIFAGVIYATFLELKAMHQGAEKKPTLIKIAVIAGIVAMALLIILAVIGVLG